MNEIERPAYLYEDKISRISQKNRSTAQYEKYTLQNKLLVITTSQISSLNIAIKKLKTTK